MTLSLSHSAGQYCFSAAAVRYRIPAQLDIATTLHWSVQLTQPILQMEIQKKSTNKNTNKNTKTNTNTNTAAVQYQIAAHLDIFATPCHLSLVSPIDSANFENTNTNTNIDTNTDTTPGHKAYKE